MSVHVIGNGNFERIGTPRWIPGALGELDALELVYQGAYTKLDEFRNTLNRWSPSRLDSNMFLESFPDDGDGIKPKVTLRYIGCRGGRLPVGKKEGGTTVQSASSTKSFSNLGKESSFTAEITYYSPTNSYTWISITKGSGGNADAPDGNVELISARVNGAAGTVAFNADILSAYFLDETTSVTHSEELVPGKYWRNTNTKQKIKIPRALSLG